MKVDVLGLKLAEKMDVMKVDEMGISWVAVKAVH